ncbi:hypothetical protein MIPYR_30006 [uncultured Microbacterium sp.]|uniref:Uncharacterized protein n=1 Tax=uncultured Microbacterium sp. TaxID=191216 RepID=A0A1Y5P4H6_9MICO|nr:hypothetical protein MIPYR_30006 [uncultured Microbacterium sp.]
MDDAHAGQRHEGHARGDLLLPRRAQPDPGRRAGHRVQPVHRQHPQGREEDHDDRAGGARLRGRVRGGSGGAEDLLGLHRRTRRQRAIGRLRSHAHLHLDARPQGRADVDDGCADGPHRRRQDGAVPARGARVVDAAIAAGGLAGRVRSLAPQHLTWCCGAMSLGSLPPPAQLPFQMLGHPCKMSSVPNLAPTTMSPCLTRT